jgi:hypothetical protein
MWLDPIHEVLRDNAVASLNAGDTVGFLCTASNEHSFALVAMNASILREKGIYEAALLHAFTAMRTNNRAWSLVDLAFLFETADRTRLRSLGDPLPGGPYTLYRGVAGHGRARRIRGISWTDDCERAQWFAQRHASTLHDPAVYQVTVNESNVLACLNESYRNEREYVVLLPPGAKVKPSACCHATGPLGDRSADKL